MKIIIVGGGKVGSYLASLLLEAGHEVRLIENRIKQIEQLKNDFQTQNLILGSGSHPEILESAGIIDADVLAVVTGSDEVNLVAASIARQEYQVPRIVARIKNPKNAWLYTPEMGVDVALNQAELIGTLVAEEMSLGSMMTLLKLHQGSFSLVEEKVHPKSPANGTSLTELQLPADCIFAAIIRDSKLLIPHGDTLIQAKDEVIAIVSTDASKQLAALLGPPLS
ncbi:TrkA family potassium uptake protein [Eubacteriaceae bacterium ES3]|nr:TrkA family potassium uptake protein [Eubacteriaceae bacterium ES3]